MSLEWSSYKSVQWVWSDRHRRVFNEFGVIAMQERPMCLEWSRSKSIQWDWSDPRTRVSNEIGVITEQECPMRLEWSLYKSVQWDWTKSDCLVLKQCNVLSWFWLIWLCNVWLQNTQVTGFSFIKGFLWQMSSNLTEVFGFWLVFRLMDLTCSLNLNLLTF